MSAAVHRASPASRSLSALLTAALMVTHLVRGSLADSQGPELDDLQADGQGNSRILLQLDDKVYDPPLLKPQDGNNFRKAPTTASPPSPDDDGAQPQQQSHKYKSANPTPRPRPDLANKKQIQWFEDTHYYALKASNDDRFRIRHAPIPERGTPWPMPQVYQPSYTVFHLNPLSFQIHPIGENCDILESAFKRLIQNIFVDSVVDHSSILSDPVWDSTDPDETVGSSRVIHSLNVTVLKECEGVYPQLDMDESYDLEVKKTGASLIAREVWGALRGMETFSQLVYQNDNYQYLVNKTYVHDYPRFPHRGIHLDTARHYLNMDTIITNLEIMAQNKMNVFHWHIVDDQSFPFESKVFPDLTKKGAYDPHTHVYTHADIQEVVEEARLRGIRVIPEFDTPGHTFSWGYGQDFLLTPCYDYQRQPDGFYGPINPILKATYRFLQALFSEVLQVFTDKYVHLGGDEVPFDCWYSNPFLNSFIRRNNLTDARDLLNLYERKLFDIIGNLGRTRDQGSGYIVWQEVFDNGVKLKPDTIVQVWSGDAFDIGRVTGAGFRALFSTCWYLDYTNYGQDWDKYYKCEQIGQMLEDYRVPNQTLIQGGEACLWTEYADNESIMPRLWPRASAAAERLWSNRYLVDVEAAAPRIEEQRCRMIRRGLPVGVLGGPGYCRTAKKGGVKPGRDWRMSGTPQSSSGGSSEGGYRIGNVYIIDVNAIYLVPLLVVICLFCVVLFTTVFPSESKNRLLAACSFPRHFKARSLIMVFSLFVLVWFIWTSHTWLHLWENGSRRVRNNVT